MSKSFTIRAVLMMFFLLMFAIKPHGFTTAEQLISAFLLAWVFEPMVMDCFKK